MGLRKNTASMPNVCGALIRFVDQVRPGFIFSAVALFQEVKTPVRKNSRNAPFPNFGHSGGTVLWRSYLGGGSRRVHTGDDTGRHENGARLGG